MSLINQNGNIYWQEEPLVIASELSSETSSRISADDILSSSIEYLNFEVGFLNIKINSNQTETNRAIASTEDQISNTEYNLSTETINRISADASLSIGLSIETSERITAVASIDNLFSTNLTLSDLLVQRDTTMLGNLTIIGQGISVIISISNLDISNNIIELNAGAASLSNNYKDTGIICERGSNQYNVFSGYKEANDTYSIFYTNDQSDFSGNNISIDGGYVNLQVNNLDFVDGSCNNLVIQGINVMSSLSTETSNRISADNSLLVELSIETSNRIDTDNSINNDITYLFNQITGLSSDLSTEISSRISGDASLSSGLSTEISSRTSGDVSLSSGLSREISSRISGDASLSSGLSREISSRISWDVSLSSGLSREISSRISGDTSLSSGLSTEISSRISGDASLSSGLSTETSARISGDKITNIYLNDFSGNLNVDTFNIDISLNANTSTFVTNNLPIVEYNQLTSFPILPSLNNVGVNGIVKAVRANGPNIYIGGTFTIAGGKSANNIAMYNTITKTWSALESGVNGTVNTIVAIGSNIYVGGTFTIAGGSLANRIAIWNGLTWSKLGTGVINNGVNDTVNALFFYRGILYIGGNFTNAGGVVGTSYICKWSSNTYSLVSIEGGTNGPVFAFALGKTADRDYLYVGGSFGRVGGIYPSPGYTMYNIGLLIIDRVTPSNAYWEFYFRNNGVNSIVYSITGIDTRMIIGGVFTRAGLGTNPSFITNRIALGSWDGNEPKNFVWSNIGNIPNGQVNALGYINGKIYVGGNFTNAGGVIGANDIAVCDLNNNNTWSTLGGGLGGAVAVNAFSISNDDIYMGGVFNTNTTELETITLNNITKILPVEYNTQTVNLYVNSNYIYTAKRNQTIKVEVTDSGVPYGLSTLFYDVA